MKFLLSFLICLFLLACAGVFSSKDSLGSMTDPRDGQTYKTVKIGSQTWMAQNLNYKTDSSFCYNDDSSNCAKYGRLYKLSTAVGKPESECGKGKPCSLPSGYIQGVCPSGWHLPSRAEWDTLIAAAGGKSVAGKVLKSSSGWEKNKEAFSKMDLLGLFGPSPLVAWNKWSNSGNGDDDFLFSAMPGGCRTDFSKLIYSSLGKYTIFWTSTIRGCSSAELVSFSYEYSSVGAGGDPWGSYCYANPVRCLKDENVRKVENPVEHVEVTVDSMTDPRDSQTYKTVKIGSQTWMAQNLNYEMDYSYCFGDDTANCDKYGRLYKWNAANSACPEGWYLPSMAEWDTLFSIVGGDSTAGKVLKSTSGWDACGDGTDAVSFSVLPAGLKNPDGWWFFKGEQAVFWSSTEVDSSIANSVELVYRFDNAQVRNYNKDLLFSIRCLKGEDRREGNAATPIPSSVVPHSVAESDSGRKDSGSKAGMTDFITDSRDGHKYKTVKIGSQTWMAENLNYKTDSSFCYKDSASYCDKYGRLYTWAAATTACPEGWHLPSDDEWNTLRSVVGKRLSIGAALRSTSGWGGNTKSLDAFGFSVLRAGYRYISHVERHIGGGRFEIIGSSPKYDNGGHTFFWGTAENNDAFRVHINWYSESADISSDKENAYSVRCLKD